MRSIDQAFYPKNHYTFVSQRNAESCNVSYIYFVLLQCFYQYKGWLNDKVKILTQNKDGVEVSVCEGAMKDKFELIKKADEKI